MGSKSDWGVMSAAVETLKDFGIENEVRIISAHRTWRQISPGMRPPMGLGSSSRVRAELHTSEESSLQ